MLLVHTAYPAMSETSTRRLIEQTEFFDKLDLVVTAILIAAGIITFPPACFVYYRILTLKSFKKQYLMKLFVLNGASNMLIYLVNLIAVQFCNWPSMYGFYTWLNSSFLRLILRYLQDFARTVMWQTTFFISLNRLLSLKHQFLLSKYDYRYFLVASLSSLSVSVIIASPLFFSRYTYDKITVGKDSFAYLPVIFNDYKWTHMPADIYTFCLAFGSLLCDTLICALIMQMRKEYNAKMKTRPEQGVLAASVIALLTHTLHEMIFASTSVLNNITIVYCTTLTLAISTTLPFWSLILFAHSMRHAVFSGTPFGRSISSNGIHNGIFSRTSSLP